MPDIKAIKRHSKRRRIHIYSKIIYNHSLRSSHKKRHRVIRCLRFSVRSRCRRKRVMAGIHYYRDFLSVFEVYLHNLYRPLESYPTPYIVPSLSTAIDSSVSSKVQDLTGFPF